VAPVLSTLIQVDTKALATKEPAHEIILNLPAGLLESMFEEGII